MELPEDGRLPAMAAARSCVVDVIRRVKCSVARISYADPVERSWPRKQLLLPFCPTTEYDWCIRKTALLLRIIQPTAKRRRFDESIVLEGNAGYKMVE